MKKILAIVGPTASGKTAFALKIAQQVLKSQYTGVDIISVDSRQVYRGLAVVTGADVPQDFKKINSDENFEYPYFQHSKFKINLHGISIIGVDGEWSLAHFKNFAIKIILNSINHNRLPILVGGTGLYHQQLFSKDEKLFISPNLEVRKKSQKLSVMELQDWLKKINSQKYLNLNHSDQNNPRRLIRAIEIELNSHVQSIQQNNQQNSQLPENLEITTLCLNLPLEEMKAKILKRVQMRFNSGAVDEVKKLLKMCRQQKLPVCSTLGVADILDYLENQVTTQECQENWALHEYQYAKRQLTWYKKQNCIWLDDLEKKQYTFK
jgi:tRNA dimethylallyltransferase